MSEKEITIQRQDLSIHQGGRQRLWTDELGDRRKKKSWLDG